MPRPRRNDVDPDAVALAIGHLADPGTAPAVIIRVFSVVEHLAVEAMLRLLRVVEEQVSLRRQANAPVNAALEERLIQFRQDVQRAATAGDQAKTLKEHPHELLEPFRKAAEPMFERPQAEAHRAPGPSAPPGDSAPTTTHGSDVLVETLQRCILFDHEQPLPLSPEQEKEMMRSFGIKEVLLQGLSRDDDRDVYRRMLRWQWQLRERWQRIPDDDPEKRTKIEFDWEVFLRPRRRKSRRFELELVRYLTKHAKPLQRLCSKRQPGGPPLSKQGMELIKLFGLNEVHRSIGCPKGTLKGLQTYKMLQGLLPAEEQRHPLKVDRSDKSKRAARHQDFESSLDDTEQNREQGSNEAERQQVLRRLKEFAPTEHIPGLAEYLRQSYEAGELTAAFVYESIKDDSAKKSHGRRPRPK